MKKEEVAKSKKDSSSSGKAKKIFLYSFAILGVLLGILVLIIILVMIFSGPSDDINTIASIEENYLSNDKSFFQEWAIADPYSIVSLASLPRAKEALENSKVFLSNMEGNSSLILSKISEIKGDYSNEKLNWLNLVEECYKSRSDMISSLKTAASNEEKYFNYYAYNEQFIKESEKFADALDDYLYYYRLGNNQGIIDSLNKMRTSVNLLKEYSEGAYDAIPFDFYQKRIIWATKYTEAIDLELSAYSSNSNSAANNAVSKYQEAAKSTEGLTDSSINEEFDEWYTSKVTLELDNSNRKANNANTACEKASDVYDLAFSPEQ